MSKLSFIILIALTLSSTAHAGCEVLDTEVVKGCRDLGAISLEPMNGVDHCRERAAGYDYSLALDFFPGPECDENWRQTHMECYGCSY